MSAEVHIEDALRGLGDVFVGLDASGFITPSVLPLFGREARSFFDHAREEGLDRHQAEAALEPLLTALGQWDPTRVQRLRLYFRWWSR